MNIVVLMGRLTRDAEVKYTSGSESTAVARMSIAVDRRYKREGQPSADFINLVAFGKTAEFFGKYGLKGTKFCIQGRIQTGSYENSEGRKIYTFDVIVESAEFAESKKSAAGEEAPPADGDVQHMADVFESEIPFT